MLPCVTSHVTETTESLVAASTGETGAKGPGVVLLDWESQRVGMIIIWS